MFTEKEATEVLHSNMVMRGTGVRCLKRCGGKRVYVYNIKIKNGYNVRKRKKYF